VGLFWFGRWGRFGSDSWLDRAFPMSVSEDGGGGIGAVGALLAAASISHDPVPETVPAPAVTAGTMDAGPPVIWLLPLDSEPAATPAVWLLPRDSEPAEALSPLGDAENPGVALASFVTPSGTHVGFLSSDPAMGIGGGLFINTDNRTIMSDGDRDRSGIGDGPDDQLVIGGDNGTLSLAAFGNMFERVVLLAGSNYSLTAGGGMAGHTLTVSAAALGANNHLVFDGSAESHSAFVLEGGNGNDVLVGGGGDDVIMGGGGIDGLAGGAGADRFVYMSPGESTGAGYDTILDFAFGQDVLDLPVTVQGMDAAVTKGALSLGSFDADLAAALGAAALEAGHALFFTPDSGQLAGQTFLVVDANGEAGYQAGADYVIHFGAPPPADFHGTFFA
jgi:hypothetical protein